MREKEICIEFLENLVSENEKKIKNLEIENQEKIKKLVSENEEKIKNLISENEEKIKNMKDLIKDNELKITELNNCLSTFEKQRDDDSLKISELNKEIFCLKFLQKGDLDNLSQEISKLTENNNSLHEEIKSKDDLFKFKEKELMTKIEEIKKINEELLSRNKKFNETIAELENSKNERLMVESENFNLSIINLEGNLIDSKKKNKDLACRLKISKENHLNDKKLIEELQNTKLSLDSDNEKLSKANLEYKKLIAKLIEKLQNTDNQKLSEAHLEDKKLIENLIEKLQNTTLSLLETHLKDKKLNEKLQNMCDNLISARDTENKNKKALENEINKLKQTISNLENEKKMLLDNQRMHENKWAIESSERNKEFRVFHRIYLNLKGFIQDLLNSMNWLPDVGRCYSCGNRNRGENCVECENPIIKKLDRFNS